MIQSPVLKKYLYNNMFFISAANIRQLQIVKNETVDFKPWRKQEVKKLQNIRGCMACWVVVESYAIQSYQYWENVWDMDITKYGNKRNMYYYMYYMYYKRLKLFGMQQTPQHLW